MKGLTLLLIGAAIGAGAVALFTTQAGADLRRQIRDFLVRKGIIPTDDIDELVEIIAAEIQNGKAADSASAVESESKK